MTTRSLCGQEAAENLGQGAGREMIELTAGTNLDRPAEDQSPTSSTCHQARRKKQNSLSVHRWILPNHSPKCLFCYFKVLISSNRFKLIYSQTSLAWSQVFFHFSVYASPTHLFSCQPPNELNNCFNYTAWWEVEECSIIYCRGPFGGC